MGPVDNKLPTILSALALFCCVQHVHFFIRLFFVRSPPVNGPETTGPKYEKSNSGLRVASLCRQSGSARQQTASLETDFKLHSFLGRLYLRQQLP